MTGDLQPRLSDLDLAGERVRLRPVRSEDAAVAFPMIHGREEVLRWLVWKGPVDLPELERAYSRWCVIGEQGVDYKLAIEELESGRFCGTVGLRFIDHPFVGDLGYWIGEEWWGQGLGSEAVLLAAHLAFHHLRSGALVAEVFEGNEASERILLKTGFEAAFAPATAPLDHPEGAGLEIDRPKRSFALSAPRFRMMFDDLEPAIERVHLED